MRKTTPRTPTTPATAPLELLTVSEAAALLKVKRATIYNGALRKLLPFIRVSNRLRIDAAELRAYLHQHRERPAA